MAVWESYCWHKNKKKNDPTTSENNDENKDVI